jgi:DNA-binding transcriptional LysR family regulator
MEIGYEASNLAQREADIALRWMGPGSQNSLIGRKVADVAFGLFASEDYIARRPEKLVSKDDLAGHDNVMFQINKDDYMWPKYDDGNYYPHGRMTFRSNSLQAHGTAIMQGYGIGILPLCFADTSSTLQRVLQEETHHEDLWIVAHEDLTKSTRIRAVFDFLVDAILKDRAFFYLGEPSIFEAGQSLTCGGAQADSPDHAHVLEPRKLEVAE